MKHKLIVFLLITACFCYSGLSAQVKQATIIDDLETLVPGEGIIQISGDSKIKDLIGALSPETSLREGNTIKTNGFRIQVFTSNDSKTATSELNNKWTLIRNVFPELAVYKSYIAPNWKLIAGNFLTREEAEVFRQKMLKEIPQLGKEMYIISSIIEIPMSKSR